MQTRTRHAELSELIAKSCAPALIHALLGRMPYTETHRDLRIEVGWGHDASAIADRLVDLLSQHGVVHEFLAVMLEQFPVGETAERIRAVAARYGVSLVTPASPSLRLVP